MTHTATYDPGDNKLRLYPAHRLSKDDYDRAKVIGFRWAPKQELFFCVWTPRAEDLLLEWCDEIGDEDKSLVDRAEERADRFSDYSANRLQDAENAHQAVSRIADGIPLGQPILVGHHSERHARRDAAKIENGMRKAVQMWDQSNYWKDRAAGALSHAKYKELPAVRARRIKTLEAELRSQLRTKTQAETHIRLWNKPDVELTWDRARALANSSDLYFSRCFTLAEYPRLTPDASKYEGSMGIWSALEGIITPEQAREIVTTGSGRTIAHCERWIEHLSHRLEYEHAMLEDAGGTEADKVKPEVGGGCRCWASPRGGWSYIQKVNKVSVTLLDNWGNGGGNFTRTLPFDKLSALMTKAEVEEKRAASLLIEDAQKLGFFLADSKPEPPKPRHSSSMIEDCTVSDCQGFGLAASCPGPIHEAHVDAIRETLKQGVQVVTANQLFPTPERLAKKMIGEASIEPGQRILEPSAGTGNLLTAIYCNEITNNVEVVAIEINGTLTEQLSKRFPGTRVICTDFLERAPDAGLVGKFDRIVMNPPFENGADIKHIQHAITFLKPGGRLVAICANGPRQQEKLKPIADTWEELPDGTFEGIGVRTVLLTINAPTEKHERKREHFGFDDKPMLAENAKEAVRMTYAGRRPELLREAKTFDEARLEKSPLFADHQRQGRLL